MKVRCLYCLTVIESKSRHDFMLCACGAVGIDGGNEYVRCSLGRPKDTTQVINQLDDDTWPIESVNDD